MKCLSNLTKGIQKRNGTPQPNLLGLNLEGLPVRHEEQLKLNDRASPGLMSCEPISTGDLLTGPHPGDGSRKDHSLLKMKIKEDEHPP